MVQRFVDKKFHRFHEDVAAVYGKAADQACYNDNLHVGKVDNRLELNEVVEEHHRGLRKVWVYLP